MKIVDIHGLADLLLTTKRAIGGMWKEYPHFHTNDSKSVRTARFIVEDVFKHLRKESAKPYANKRPEEPKKMDRSSKEAEQAILEKRIQLKGESERLGGRKKTAIGDSNRIILLAKENYFHSNSQ